MKSSENWLTLRKHEMPDVKPNRSLLWLVSNWQKHFSENAQTPHLWLMHSETPRRRRTLRPLRNATTWCRKPPARHMRFVRLKSLRFANLGGGESQTESCVVLRIRPIAKVQSRLLNSASNSSGAKAPGGLRDNVAAPSYLRASLPIPGKLERLMLQVLGS